MHPCLPYLLGLRNAVYRLQQFVAGSPAVVRPTACQRANTLAPRPAVEERPVRVSGPSRSAGRGRPGSEGGSGSAWRGGSSRHHHGGLGGGGSHADTRLQPTPPRMQPGSQQAILLPCQACPPHTLFPPMVVAPCWGEVLWIKGMILLNQRWPKTLHAPRNQYFLRQFPLCMTCLGQHHCMTLKGNLM
jgi:hypothetical protein